LGNYFGWTANVQPRCVKSGHEIKSPGHNGSTESRFACFGKSEISKNTLQVFEVRRHSTLNVQWDGLMDGFYEIQKAMGNQANGWVA
jgi:hypothetical protein